jgi:hypothetical protein
MRLSDLTLPQAAVLLTLDRERPDVDRMGEEMFAIEEGLVQTIDDLVKLGLAQWVIGRSMKAWFMLTDEGLLVREGAAA